MIRHQKQPPGRHINMPRRGGTSSGIVEQVARRNSEPEAELRIAMPSGVLTAAASVKQVNGGCYAEVGSFYRT